MKQMIQRFLSKLGYRVVRLKTLQSATAELPVEFSAEEMAIIDLVLHKQLTMVSRERLYATVMACKHVLTQSIPGDFVECGVWRGGNSIVAAHLFARGDGARSVYLFDTFAGMTAPSAQDFRARDNRDAMIDYIAHQKETHNEWCYASLPDVTRNFSDLNLLTPNIKFVEGDVVESLKSEANLPRTISVLRLDTDWYESTRTELEVLYPRLSRGGVLILDDYGHWGGAMKAVDEYFENRPRPLLQYTDYTGRMGVKLA